MTACPVCGVYRGPGLSAYCSEACRRESQPPLCDGGCGRRVRDRGMWCMRCDPMDEEPEREAMLLGEPIY